MSNQLFDEDRYPARKTADDLYDARLVELLEGRLAWDIDSESAQMLLSDIISTIRDKKTSAFNKLARIDVLFVDAAVALADEEFDYPDEYFD